MATNERIALVTGAGSGAWTGVGIGVTRPGTSGGTCRTPRRRTREDRRNRRTADPAGCSWLRTDVSKPDSVNALFGEGEGRVRTAATSCLTTCGPERAGNSD